ncbi:TRAP dicarboxylate transporter, DctM subunit [Desulforamulus reducens MI-1]|uniref:TRAP dicarboxylate transporter, DctM subunit n=1 Tax=Desulforamulus reducens (strain ATCC BAA-1160 / DSM 100696 / MI-1) TaxID=349161 RepID=A4J1K4_DESRM|nr:TRAP transporter large permease [Desulforamulus reducens]ABO48957.1 TRAP dicarboxylate transporter, DctM subunit [Desulforamulus reducens MI-1]
MTIALVFISLAIFLLLSIPIGISIGLSVLVGMIVGQDLPTAFLIQKMIASLDSFPLLAVPFFIMAGEIMQKGSMAQRLLAVSRTLVGHITGGMAHISVLTCMFYGALSGSAPATVAAVGGIMIPSMEKEGYDKPFSTAVNTAAGCLGVMIPPSVPLIIYGTTAGVSVGDLFIAGVIPGLFVGMFLMATSYIISKKKGYKGSGQRSNFKDMLKALNEAKFALVVPVIVLGGIYGGLTTPTEAGVIAVIYAFLAEGFIHRALNWSKVYEVIRGSALTTASIFLVVATATGLGQILMFYNVPDLLVNFLVGISENKYVLMPIILLFLVVMGTFMDALANILILTPLLLPVVQKIGIDPVHFGIVMIVVISMGFLTPPVGVNLFVGCGISKLRIEVLSKAVIPFLIAMFIAVLALAFIPQITLWLPSLMVS